MLACSIFEELDFENPHTMSDGEVEFFQREDYEGASIRLRLSVDGETGMRVFTFLCESAPKRELEDVSRNVKLELLAYLDGQEVASFHVLGNHELIPTPEVGLRISRSESGEIKTGGAFGFSRERTDWQSFTAHVDPALPTPRKMIMAIHAAVQGPALPFDFDAFYVLQAQLLLVP